MRGFTMKAPLRKGHVFPRDPNTADRPRLVVPARVARAPRVAVAPPMSEDLPLKKGGRAAKKGC